MFILCSCWVKEILEFLSQFTDASDGLDASAQPTVHPLTFVVNSFKTPDSAAAKFENLLGGSPASAQAARYLRLLADNRLPQHALHPLPFLESVAPPQVMPRAREEPHPCVVAVLCPSVPLRAIWRRGR